MSKTPENPDKTLCLCMIVKNEAHIIRRAIESVRDLIDYWVICDTGSTDSTQQHILSALDGVPGELHERPWVNFGANRTEVVGLATGKSDYILVMDADMVAEIGAAFKHKLTADYYEIRYAGGLDYAQPMLISNRHEWKYIGVTHEYLHAESAKTWDFLPELKLRHLGDGGSRSDKFERDVQLLTEGLKEEPDNERYHFYLAQSYKDLERWEEALFWYEKRLEGEGWLEEKWYAMFQKAEMKRLLEKPAAEVRAAYLEAWDFRPVRLEPLYALLRHYREAGEYLQGYVLSVFSLKGIDYPEQDLLFIEKPVYEYLFLLEHAACALACGRNAEAIDALNQMLKAPSLPVEVYHQGIEARSMALARIQGEGKTENLKKPRLKVVVPFHNPGKFLRKCVYSLLAQDAQDFQVIFIDDASSDEGAEFYPPERLPSILLRNESRRGTTYNVWQAVSKHCEPEDVVVCLDGDDTLYCQDALSHVQQLYAQYDCWVMYGQYVQSDGFPGISAPFSSPEDFLGLRRGWRTSHIRTFRAGLFHRIAEQDPGYSCLKDEQGHWLQNSVDAALMFPLLEMAGFGRTHFCEKVLYRYNVDNPRSHHHLDRQNQRGRFDEICSRRPFARVGHYFPAYEMMSMKN